MAAYDHSRRMLLTGRRPDGVPPVRPPWSREAAVLSACTGCGACIDACPQAIVRTGGGGYPELDLGRGECTFCGRCAEVCPEPVFDRAPAPFPHLVAIGEGCLAAAGVVCQSCGDACPEAAIRFAPRLGGPPLPRLAENRCTGCGACIAVCPEDAVAVALRSEA